VIPYVKRAPRCRESSPLRSYTRSHVRHSPESEEHLSFTVVSAGVGDRFAVIRERVDFRDGRDILHRSPSGTPPLARIRIAGPLADVLASTFAWPRVLILGALILAVAWPSLAGRPLPLRPFGRWSWNQRLGCRAVTCTSEEAGQALASRIQARYACSWPPAGHFASRSRATPWCS
jgi:hypothetical protein